MVCTKKDGSSNSDPTTLHYALFKFLCLSSFSYELIKVVCRILHVEIFIIGGVLYSSTSSDLNMS